MLLVVALGRLLWIVKYIRSIEKHIMQQVNMKKHLPKLTGLLANGHLEVAKVADCSNKRDIIGQRWL